MWLLQYADWCAGGNKDSFFTDSYCQQLYMNHIKTFVNRCPAMAPPAPEVAAADGMRQRAHEHILRSSASQERDAATALQLVHWMDLPCCSSLMAGAKSGCSMEGS